MDRAEIQVVINGPGLTPQTADPRAVLNLARVILELMDEVAEDQRLPLSLQGLEIRSGSVTVAVQTLDPTSIAAVERMSAELVSGVRIPSTQRLAKATGAVRRVVSRLPQGQGVSLRSAGLPDLPLHAGTGRATTTARVSTTEFRARLVTVGGKKPAAKFVSAFEGDGELLTFQTDEDMAMKLGAFVYKDVDITVELHRDEDGEIVSGKLLEFRPVTSTNPLQAWRSWFAENAKHWDGVDDVEAELARDGR